MARGPTKIWKGLPLIALGLMLFGDFAPVSDSLDTVLLGTSIVILLSFSSSYLLLA